MDALLAHITRLWRIYRSRRGRTRARVAAMSRWRRLRRRVVHLLVAMTLLVAMSVTAVVVLYSTLTDVPPLADMPVGQVATIQYSDGSTLARVGEVDRDEVRLADIPATVRWAFLSAEDRNFYGEPGFSIKGTVRAAWSDLTGSGGSQGGSGITQQLVKNVYVGNAHSLKRKLTELMIAVKLSRKYSKDTILRYYLNTAYFGRGAYGIEAAAHAYFRRDVRRLTTAQGALLAALLRAPSYYDPAAHPAAARQRWHYAIDGLVATGRLTRARAASLGFPATARPTVTDLGTVGWRHILVGRIFADLAAHGISSDDVFAHGMTIRTTIDEKTQAAAVDAVARSARARAGRRPDVKAAVVALDPTSGGILAYYGGTGPSVPLANGRVDDFDYATDGYRLGGATLQPYVLATALTQTLTRAPGRPRYTIDSPVDASPCVVIHRTPVCAPTGLSGTPSSITVSEAMQLGSKTVFDVLAADAGPDEVAALAHRMGVSTSDAQGNPTLVDPNGDTSFGIGSGLYAVSPLDQATGYATLADGGLRNPAYLVQSATSSSGHTVYRHRARPVRVLDPKVAHDVTRTLGPQAPSPQSRRRPPGEVVLSDTREAAVKTGTVALDARQNSDAWTVGYTPRLVTAVWFGSGSDKPVVTAGGRPMTGADEPATVWRQVVDTHPSGRDLVGHPAARLGRQATR